MPDKNDADIRDRMIIAWAIEHVDGISDERKHLTWKTQCDKLGFARLLKRGDVADRRTHSIRFGNSTKFAQTRSFSCYFLRGQNSHNFV